MKTKDISLFLLLLIMSCLSINSVLFSQWQQSEFVIGAFVGPNLQGVTDAVAIQRFQQVRDAHFNLIVYPFHVYDYEYPNGTIFSEAYNDRSISISSQVGIKYMVNDSRHMPASFWNQSSPTSTYDGTIASQMVTHYQGLSTQAAMYGYSLKDEPSPSTINSSHLPFLRNYISYIKTNHSSKLAYLNMLPYYAFATKNAYETYLDEYLLNGASNQKPQAFGFDYYLENNPSTTNFFYNLSIIRTKAQGRPFWAYPRVALLQGVDADNSYIRFGVFSALAYGAKGLIYYTYETRTVNTALASNGTTTTKYTWVQNINNYVKNVVGPAIISSHSIGTYHKADFKNNSGTTLEVLPTSEKISSSPFVTDLDNDQSMIGEFYDEINKVIYLLVVNKGYNDSFASINTTVELPGDLRNKIYTTSTNGSPNWNYNSVSSTFSNNFTYFTVSNLLPGEGRLYKVIDCGLGMWDWQSSNAIYGDATNIPVPADYDGDGKTDLSIKNSLGQWKIDYASNGFGSWDVSYSGYGDGSSIPVPADYDGDNKADLSIKNSLGEWKIDYASDGFGSFNITYNNYGGTDTHPVPADYDGDGKADLSVKADWGSWYIDYASNGFGSWDNIYYNYGGSDAHPVPADYDGDGKADLSVKADWGSWYINYAADGFANGWDLTVTGYGDASNIPVPADYDGDLKADLSIKNNSGEWKIDFASNSFTGWDDFNFQYGSSDAHPITGDYNGDGKADFSVKTDGGNWYIDYSGFKEKYLNKSAQGNNNGVEEKIIDDYVTINNYPNPFNPTTMVSYQISKPGFVTIKVFDVLGKELQTLVKDYKKEGHYTVTFDGTNLSSGTYFYQITVGNKLKSGKMLLMK